MYHQIQASRQQQHHNQSSQQFGKVLEEIIIDE
jgi:hypothetical protein